MTLQRKSSEANKEDSRHTNPDRPIAQQLRRSTLELGRRSSIAGTSRSRRSRRRVGGCRRASQILDLEVATSKGLAQASIGHELGNVERETHGGQVAVLRGKGEVGGLLEHDDIVVMRDIAYGRRGLQVGYGTVRNNERCRVRDRGARTESHVRGDPVHELDASSITWDVEVYNEKNAGRVVALGGSEP